MEIIRGIDNYTQRDKPLYVALGNFDGIHLGHKKLISDMINIAHTHDGIAACLIFQPHPAQVLNPEKAPKLLVTPERKAELLEELGLDILIYTDFTLELAKWTPEEFVQKILLDKLCAKEVFIGFNYSFGYKGAGTPELLADLGSNKFKVNIISPIKVEGEVVSSSLIRKLLETGEISTAQFLLGYTPVWEGKVIKGEQRGATIGFPTANVAIENNLIVPGKGVYAATTIIDGKTFISVVNIGSKPTFHEKYPISIEAHIINFNQDIYGKNIKLNFLKKIRDEKKFSGVNELVAQIKQDCQHAYNIGKNQFHA